MSKEITNNQLADQITELSISNNQLAVLILNLDQKFDGLENRFDDFENKFHDLTDEVQSGFAIMKMSFDESFERLDKNDQEHLLMKHELARVGDTCVRIEGKLDLENAAHHSRFERLEQHCGI